MLIGVAPAGTDGSIGPMAAAISRRWAGGGANVRFDVTVGRVRSGFIIGLEHGHALADHPGANAIVFGSGYVTIGQMVRAGIWVDVLSITVVTLVATFLLPVVFG